jgi:taurine-pyruvate aminotransferase
LVPELVADRGTREPVAEKLVQKLSSAIAAQGTITSAQPTSAAVKNNTLNFRPH